MDDFTNSFKTSKSLGWVSIADLPPPLSRLPHCVNAGPRGHDRSCCVRCPRNRCYPAASRGPRFTHSKQPTFSLVQERRQRIETRRDRSGINHTTRVDAPASVSLPFTDWFVALLPQPRFFSSDSVVQAQALSQARDAFTAVPGAQPRRFSAALMSARASYRQRVGLPVALTRWRTPHPTCANSR
jgi:hypothetical protein